MRPVRVASYNTRDFLDDRDAAASVVRAIDPDVLCLQEVPRRLGAAWRVSRFAGACGMAWVGRHRGSGGTTIFVSERIRVSGAGHHRLPVRLLDRTRGYAVAHLVIDGWQPLTAVSLHLSLRPEERQRHAGAILAALAIWMLLRKLAKVKTAFEESEAIKMLAEEARWTDPTAGSKAA